MAVYYKWIKGCEPGATLDTKQWTYVCWGSGADKDNTNSMPILKISTGKSDDPSISLGYFLTNDMATPTLKNYWNFTTGIKFNNKGTIIPDGDNIKISSGKLIITNTTTASASDGALKIGGGLRVDKKVNIGEGLTVGDSSTFWSTVTIADTTEGTSSAGALKINGGATIAKSVYIGSTLTTAGSCSADYFNATSDRRAKENIEIAKYSALEMISKLSIYNYNYKLNPSERMTGIMAQDLLEVQPKELDLVSNTNATGESGDYMSIKNDKLMFVLMKAIQEQQEIINSLQREIDKLKTI